MARPRRDSGIVPAKQRLENAFWAMLAEREFAGITIEAICQRAAVNHNTFYYYFDNLDQMAAVLVDANLVPELPRMVLAGLTRDQPRVELLLGDPDLRRRFERVQLLLGPHADQRIHDQLKASVTQLWLDSLDAKADDQHLRAFVTFVIGGMLSILGTDDLGDRTQLMAWMADDFGPIIQTVLNSRA